MMVLAIMYEIFYVHGCVFSLFWFTTTTFHFLCTSSFCFYFVFDRIVQYHLLFFAELHSIHTLADKKFAYFNAPHYFDGPTELNGTF